MFGLIASSISGNLSSNFDSIATITVGAGGSGGSVSFNSIPSIYKHLQIRALVRSTTGASPENLAYMQFNGDTGTNYSYHFMLGTGSATAATGGANTNLLPLIDSTNSGTIAYDFAPTVADILDYSSTSKYKTARSLTGTDANGSGNIFLCSGLWMNTAAITSITVIPEKTAFAQYSSFALYGIKG
jgi:hypothetical protein